MFSVCVVLANSFHTGKHGVHLKGAVPNCAHLVLSGDVPNLGDVLTRWRYSASYYRVTTAISA